MRLRAGSCRHKKTQIIISVNFRRRKGKNDKKCGKKNPLGPRNFVAKLEIVSLK